MQITNWSIVCFDIATKLGNVGSPRVKSNWETLSRVKIRRKMEILLLGLNKMTSTTFDLTTIECELAATLQSVRDPY